MCLRRHGEVSASEVLQGLILTATKNYLLEPSKHRFASRLATNCSRQPMVSKLKDKMEQPRPWGLPTKYRCNWCQDTCCESVSSPCRLGCWHEEGSKLAAERESFTGDIKVRNYSLAMLVTAEESEEFLSEMLNEHGDRRLPVPTTGMKGEVLTSIARFGFNSSICKVMETEEEISTAKSLYERQRNMSAE